MGFGGNANPGYGPREPLPSDEELLREQAAQRMRDMAEQQAAEDAFQQANPGLRPRIVQQPPAPPMPVAPRVSPRARPTAAPPPPPVAEQTGARPVQAQPETQMDADEKLYMEDPEAFERMRMARAPVSGELRIGIGGRPMKSYNVGPDRGDMTGVAGAESLRDDKVFGQSRTTPAGPGALSMADDNGPNSETYRRYLANSGRLDDDAEERARVAKAEAFAADPFADQTASMRRLAQQYGAQEGAKGAREEQRFAAIERMIDMGAQQKLAELRADPDYLRAAPQARQAAEVYIQRQALMQKQQARMVGIAGNFPRADYSGVGGSGDLLAGGE